MTARSSQLARSSRPWATAIAAGVVVVALAASGSAAFTASAPTYVVQPGDTLTTIAGRLKVSLEQLAVVNGITNPDMIHVGQHLTVPGASDLTGSSPAAVRTTGPLSPVSAPAPGAPRYPSLLLAHPSRLALVPLFRYWASVFGVPAGLLESLAWMESGWQNAVVSPTGAIGIGQLEPSTAKFTSTVLLHLHTTLNARVPSANIEMSAAYLAFLLREAHWSVANALGGYYQGLASLSAHGPWTSTRTYVATIGLLWKQFRSG